MYYLIRVKDDGVGSMARSFRLPEKEEVDHTMHLLLTRKQTNEVKAHPELYKIVAGYQLRPPVVVVTVSFFPFQ